MIVDYLDRFSRHLLLCLTLPSNTTSCLCDTLQTNLDLCEDSLVIQIHQRFFLSFCLATEKCEGRNPVKADQFFPEMEEEVLQTQREDTLLCQRLQGTTKCETAYRCFFKFSNSFFLGEGDLKTVQWAGKPRNCKHTKMVEIFKQARNRWDNVNLGT